MLHLSQIVDKLSKIYCGEKTLKDPAGAGVEVPQYIQDGLLLQTIMQSLQQVKDSAVHEYDDISLCSQLEAGGELKLVVKSGEYGLCFDIMFTKGDEK